MSLLDPPADIARCPETRAVWDRIAVQAVADGRLTAETRPRFALYAQLRGLHGLMWLAGPEATALSWRFIVALSDELSIDDPFSEKMT